MYPPKDAFSVLGIEATRDRKEIKRAYAQRVKDVHPEEDPAGWKHLHDAYEQAMYYADAGGAPGAGEPRPGLAFDAFGAERPGAGTGDSPAPDGAGAVEGDSPAPDGAGAVEQEDAKGGADGAGMGQAFHEMRSQTYLDLAEAKEWLSKLFVFKGRLNQYGSEGTMKQREWILFFDSPLFARLKWEEGFWRLLIDLMKDKYVDLKIYDEIKRKLERLREEAEAADVSDEIKEAIDTLCIMLEKAKRRIRKFGIREIIRIALIILAICAFTWRASELSDEAAYTAGIPQDQACGEIAQYLNEKYGTDAYDAGSFTGYETAPFRTYIYDRSGFIHRVKLADAPGQEACLVEYDDGREPDYADNLQGPEIEQALEAHFIEKGFLGQGRAALYESENYHRLWDEEDTDGTIYPLYHVKYEAETGVEEFIGTEKLIRAAWVDNEEIDSEPVLVFEDEREAYGPWDVVMGRISLYAADAGVRDVQDGMHRWEEENMFRISMVSMPQSLYEGMGGQERLPCLDGVNAVALAGIHDGKYRSQMGEDFTNYLALPYGMDWYMWKETYRSHARQMEPGILIAGIENRDKEYRLESGRQDGETRLTLKLTAEKRHCVVLILSEEELGIGGEAITVTRKRPDEKAVKMPCLAMAEFFQTGEDADVYFAPHHENVLRADGRLMIPYMTDEENSADEIIISW